MEKVRALATEWVRTALNPFGEGERTPAAVTARPKVLTQSQFGDGGPGDLTNVDCVFLCDVERFSQAEVRRLEAHVRQSGGTVGGGQLAAELADKVFGRAVVIGQIPGGKAGGVQRHGKAALDCRPRGLASEAHRRLRLRLAAQAVDGLGPVGLVELAAGVGNRTEDAAAAIFARRGKIDFGAGDLDVGQPHSKRLGRGVPADVLLL